MKKLFFVFALFAVLYSPFLTAQENNQDQQQMMKAWQEFMTPGPMHKMLAEGVGEWKTEITMWMDPAQPPIKAEGTSVCEAVLDGRYFQSKHTSSFNNMPMMGLELSGYDNAKKVFFVTWVDNFGTGIMYLEGKYDEAAKTITYSGTATDQFAKEFKVRQTVKMIDKDNQYTEMFINQNGKEFKSMEIKMTRKKA